MAMTEIFREPASDGEDFDPILAIRTHSWTDGCDSFECSNDVSPDVSIAGEDMDALDTITELDKSEVVEEEEAVSEAVESKLFIFSFDRLFSLSRETKEGASEPKSDDIVPDLSPTNIEYSDKEATKEEATFPSKVETDKDAYETEAVLALDRAVETTQDNLRTDEHNFSLAPNDVEEEEAVSEAVESKPFIFSFDRLFSLSRETKEGASEPKSDDTVPDFTPINIEYSDKEATKEEATFPSKVETDKDAYETEADLALDRAVETTQDNLRTAEHNFSLAPNDVEEEEAVSEAVESKPFIFSFDRLFSLSRETKEGASEPKSDDTVPDFTPTNIEYSDKEATKEEPFFPSNVETNKEAYETEADLALDRAVEDNLRTDEHNFSFAPIDVEEEEAVSEAVESKPFIFSFDRLFSLSRETKEGASEPKSDDTVPDFTPTNIEYSDKEAKKEEPFFPSNVETNKEADADLALDRAVETMQDNLRTDEHNFSLAPIEEVSDEEVSEEEVSEGEVSEVEVSKKEVSEEEVSEKEVSEEEVSEKEVSEKEDEERNPAPKAEAKESSIRQTESPPTITSIESCCSDNLGIIGAPTMRESMEHEIETISFKNEKDTTFPMAHEFTFHAGELSDVSLAERTTNTTATTSTVATEVDKNDMITFEQRYITRDEKKFMDEIADTRTIDSEDSLSINPQTNDTNELKSSFRQKSKHHRRVRFMLCEDTWEEEDDFLGGILGCGHLGCNYADDDEEEPDYFCAPPLVEAE